METEHTEPETDLTIEADDLKTKVFFGGKRGAGRAKGQPNGVTVEVRAAASLIVDDPAYRAGLMARALSGRLHPAVETMLWYYSKGKPKEYLDISVSAVPADLSDEALAERARVLAMRLTDGE